MKHLRPRTRSVAVGRKWKEGERERRKAEREERRNLLYSANNPAARSNILRKKKQSWVIVIKAVSSDNI